MDWQGLIVRSPAPMTPSSLPLQAAIEASYFVASAAAHERKANTEVNSRWLRVAPVEGPSGSAKIL